ncbi:MAG TPA: DinB family protein [Chloroflexia bacterium]|nr:DinB family protein [Chloroflexia bacterium]
MTTPAVSELLYLLDAAFTGPWHSLLENLKAVTPEDWTWVPPGGTRSIRDIVGHVGGCKLMYHNHAFGDAQLTWNDPLVDGGDALATPEAAIGWLRTGQQLLRDSVAALDDSGLSRQRMTNWGEQKETRWIITVVIQHDLYHAGEINHLRSLRQESDGWAYDAG